MEQIFYSVYFFCWWIGREGKCSCVGEWAFLENKHDPWLGIFTDSKTSLYAIQ
jgi:hypothetical protein